MIQVTCPHCHTSMQVPPSFAGQSGPCRNCQQILQIPVQTVADPISYASQNPSPTSGSFPSYPPLAPLGQASGTVFNSMSSQEGHLESLQTDLKVQHLEQLGEGGMGVVLRVRDQRLGRDAALKILKSEVSSKEMEKRFLREAKITAQLDHPSIPPVYEIGHNSSGDLFLLMRVIEGDTLQKKIRDYHDHSKDPKELRELLDCLLKVSQAVDYAHSQSIVHRDLKPQNIMVGQFGEVMVMDWGLGKDLSNKEGDDFLDEKTKNITEIEEGEGLTQVGAVMGTLGYMPPEQAGGDPIDQRADIFALGAILTEILTRKVPIVGQSNTNKMVATIKGQIELPRDIDSSVPKELNAIAAKALEADLEDRIENTKDFTENLQAYLAGHEVPLYQYSTPERMKRKAQKYPGVLLGFPLVFTLLLATVFLGVQLRSAEETAKQSTQELAKTETALIDSKEQSIEKEKALQENKKALKKKNEALEKNKAALKTKKRIAQLFKDARESAQKGQDSAKIESRITKALQLSGRQFDDLLSAAEIYKFAKLNKLARVLLEEASQMDDEPRKALFRLHVLEVLEKEDLSLGSQYLQKILTVKKRTSDDNVYLLFARAHKLYREERFEEVVSECSKIEKENKRFAIVYFLRGLGHLRISKFREGIRDFTAVININPLIATAFYHRGHCYLSEKDIRNAMADFSRCVKLKPNHAASYLYRARIYYYFERIGDAQSDLAQAMKHKPRFEKAYALRADIRQKSGDKRGAFNDCNQVLQINPNNSGVLYLRAGLHKSIGSMKEAYEDYSRALRIKPDFYLALYYKIKMDQSDHVQGSDEVRMNDLNRGLILRPKSTRFFGYRATLNAKLGKINAAIEDYNAILRLKKNDPEALYLRALLLAQIGQEDVANRDIAKAIKLNKKIAKKHKKTLKNRRDSIEREDQIKRLTKSLKGTKKDEKTLRELAKLKSKQGRKEEALEDLAKALKLNPKSEKALYRYGEILVSLKRYKEAISYLDKALSLKASLTDALSKRAEAYTSLGQIDRAIDDYNKFLNIKKDSSTIYERRADLFLRKNDLDAAIKDIGSMIRLKPKDAKLYERRARIRIFKDDEGGVQDYRKAIALNPKESDYYRDLGRFFYNRGDYRSAIEIWQTMLQRFGENDMREQDRNRVIKRLNAAKDKVRK